ncbi:uncharacterized protein LOC123036613 isoform X2 [Varanus komodoensis]|uniref:uncharacterized protein LOC123036613 isoform X2 n=1 Tax=Varanus komodoensis TaxID=61221 RepID=UPI001CF77581|nr:uncharacterized protein LOC123036613 isoform X2 [Varanus komodoensis]
MQGIPRRGPDPPLPFHAEGCCFLLLPTENVLWAEGQNSRAVPRAPHSRSAQAPADERGGPSSAHRCGSSESNIWRLPSSRGQACAMDTNIPFQWGTRKTWMAVSAVELAIIFILGAGLAHLIVHRPHEQEDMERWPESNVLSSLISVNRTLQIATKSCQDQTRTLEANTTSLNSEVARLNARLRLHALEKAALQDQLTILKNWTQLFQDLKDQQKTIIGHFQKDQDLDQDPNPDHGHLSGHGPFIYLHAGLASLALAVLLCV